MARPRTVQQFDALSATWDAAHGPGSVRRCELSTRVEYLRRLCREMRKPRVLDLGCGTGQTLLHLRKEIAAGVGVDISSGMISCAQKAALGTNLHFVIADAADFCVNCTDVFDLVLFVGRIEHLPDQEAALGATERVLAGSGRIITISPHPWKPTFLARRLFNLDEMPPNQPLSPRRLENLAKRHGLELSELCALPYASWLPALQLRAHPAGRLRPVDRRNYLCGVLRGCLCSGIQSRQPPE